MNKEEFKDRLKCKKNCGNKSAIERLVTFRDQLLLNQDQEVLLRMLRKVDRSLMSVKQYSEQDTAFVRAAWCDYSAEERIQHLKASELYCPVHDKERNGTN